MMYGILVGLLPSLKLGVCQVIQIVPEEDMIQALHTHKVCILPKKIIFINLTNSVYKLPAKQQEELIVSIFSHSLLIFLKFIN